MRSPIIAFSLFAAAVSPTLVSAAPPSPKLGGDAIAHQGNAAVKSPQLLAFPRTDNPFRGVFGNLPVAESNSSHKGNTQSDDPASGATDALTSNPGSEGLYDPDPKTAIPATRHVPFEPKEPDMPRLPGGDGRRGTAGNGNGEGNGQNNTP